MSQHYCDIALLLAWEFITTVDVVHRHGNGVVINS